MLYNKGDMDTFDFPVDNCDKARITQILIAMGDHDTQYAQEDFVASQGLTSS